MLLICFLQLFCGKIYIFLNNIFCIFRIFKKHKIISKNEEADETLKTKLFCLNFIKCPALIFSLSNKVSF